MFPMALLLALMRDLLSLFDIYIVKAYGVELNCLYMCGTCRKHEQIMQLKKLQCQKTMLQFYLLLVRLFIHVDALLTDAIIWAEQQIHLLATRYPNATHFMKYLTKNWLHKVAMWCVGSYNIPHVGQDSNASIESYHTNIKDFVMLKKKIDWVQNGQLIYHLVGDVLTH